MITTQPTNQSALLNGTATFMAAASGTPAPTVKWQVSADNGANYTDLSGQNSTTLTLSNVTAGMNGNRYRAVFTNSCTTINSNAATLTIGCVSTLQVNNSGDGADATPGNGVCETATGNGVCTLRAALQEANALTACTPLTVNFSITGTINTTSVLPNIVHPNLTINGPGADQLTVRGAGTHQLFSITGTANVMLQISGLTLTNGFATTATNAGAIEFNSVGGMLTLTGAALVNNSRASGNTRAQIYSNQSGGITINNSTISGNPVGNGITIKRTPLTVTNSTIHGNAQTGILSGSTNQLHTITLLNATVANNRIGVAYTFLGTDGGERLVLKNSIIANNTGTVQIGTATSGTIVSQGNNLVSDSSLTPTASGDLINTNPLLAPLGNYGGATPTVALLPGSPAINAGSATGAPTSDQRGIARVGNVDIGAFESRGFTLAVASGNNQSAVVNAAFATPLTVAVTSANSEPVNGGQVVFAPPVSGASATVACNPATIASGVATSGTATANASTGNYNVSASANGATAVSFSLTNTCPMITVSPASLLGSTTTGAAYSQTFTQTGGLGAITWSLADSTPPGLSFNAATATLSGQPTQAGSFSFTIRATDANGCFGERMYTLGVNCATVTVSPANPALTGGTVSSPYTQNFTASGGVGPYNFTASAGTLSAGLTLAASGALTGAPTVSGIFNFTIRATDASGCFGERAYTLRICAMITLAPSSLPAGTIGVAYNQTLTASGGVAPYSLALTSGGLPPGLSLSTSGALTGTPLQSGSANFTVTATDDIGCAGTQSYTLNVNCPTITVSPSSLPLGIAGVPYSQTPTQTGGLGTVTWSVSAGALPVGLSLNEMTGQLAGMSLVAGAFNFTLRATDANGCTGSRAYTLTFRPKAKADFDNDGKTDFSVFRPDAVDPVPNWLALGSSNSQALNFSWGGGYAPYFDVPVPADYDGDGKADLAIWRGADTIWYIRPSATPNAPILELWGANYAPYFDIPTPADYDGDAKADIAVFRRTGTWFVKRSSNGANLIQEQGQQGDVPLPANGVR